VGEIWRFLRTQPASFWLVCIYLFFEYVRPQSIYESLAIFPWTSVTMLACLTAFLVEGRSFKFRTPADTLILVYTGIVLLSCITAFSPDAAFAQLPLYLSWVLVYLLIANIVDTENRFLVFILSFFLYNLKMSLHAVRAWASIGFGYVRAGMVGGPGWFHNSGEFGIEMTIFLPIVALFIFALYRKWPWPKVGFFLLMPVTIVVSVVAASSRGALLGVATAATWLILKTRYRFRALLPAAAAVIVVLTILPKEEKTRFKAAGSDPTSLNRLTYWKDGIEITKQNPLLGIGYGNWLPYYTTRYNPHGQLVHNIFIQASAELGFTGLLGFIGLIAATLIVNRRTRRLAGQLPDGAFITAMGHGLDGALIGYLTSGFFVTVLYYPYFWVNLGMTVALHNVVRSELRRAQGGAGWERVAPGHPIGNRALSRRVLQPGWPT
jgi:O-antigen ligase